MHWAAARTPGRRSRKRASSIPTIPWPVNFVATRSGDAPPELAPLVATLIAAGDRRALPLQPFVDLALIRDLSATAPMFAPAGYVGAFKAFEARRFRDAVDELRVAIARDALVIDPTAQSKALLDGIAALRREGRR